MSNIVRHLLNVWRSFTAFGMTCLFVSILFAPLSLAESPQLYPFDQPRQQAQFEHLLKELRCLVCQNQDLSDSSAGLAKDLRQQIYTMVREAKTDDEITHYLTERYGDFILFKPPLKGVTLVLWFSPIVFLMLGFFIFWRKVLAK